MTKLKIKVGTKWPKWYEMTWVGNDLGMKWPVTIVCKLLESIIRQQLINIWRNTDYFLCDSGGSVDAIYCDFMKSFHKVPHKRLVHKLKQYGIDSPHITWIESFLSNRKQGVKVNGVEWEWMMTTSGIPQGSVLGPILFVLYINDIADSIRINSDLYLYADDTKIFRLILKPDDCEEDVYDMSSSSDKWLLPFHSQKCKYMRLSNANVGIKEYRLTKDQNKRRESYRCNYRWQIVFWTEKVNKANSMLGVISRSFEHLDIKIVRLLYTNFVRPHLEYANAVWNPLQEETWLKTCKDVPSDVYQDFPVWIMKVDWRRPSTSIILMETSLDVRHMAFTCLSLFVSLEHLLR